MEFEGEDQRALSGLVRTLSGRFDFLKEGDRGASGTAAAEEACQRSVSEDEPPECRVCRGEPEPERRLYSPCLCSGSIMHTHEDCLLEWLKHSGKDSCELCGALFRFTPVYDPDAPQFVPVYQVLATCAKKTVVKWLPLLVRVILVTGLWLVFVPVCTSWLYRIWIHRSRVLLPQLFLHRLNAACIWSDCISGVIVTAAIILSFLSLMTFADFLADQLLRDDLGGIGLDGMNLVEAMAEAMDELRIDNRGREDPRIDQRENEQNHGGGGGEGDGEEGDDNGRGVDNGSRPAQMRGESEEPFENNRNASDVSDEDGFSFVDVAGTERDSHDDAPRRITRGSAETRQEGEARALPGSEGAGSGAARCAREGPGRHAAATAKGTATADVIRRRAMEEVEEDRDSISEAEANPLNAFLDLEYRPPTPPRRRHIAGRGGIVLRRTAASGAVGGRGHGMLAADSLSPRRRGSKKARDAPSVEGESTSASQRLPTPAPPGGKRSGISEVNDKVAPRPPSPIATGAVAFGNDAEPSRYEFQTAGGGGHGGEFSNEVRPRARTEGEERNLLRPTRDAELPPPPPPPPAAAAAAAAAVPDAAAVPEAAAAPDAAAGAAAARGDEEDDNDDIDDGFFDGDLDVHMAVDELLGIRGPLSMLVRNVLWLLAFHGAYLGLFAFFPFSIGASVVHAVSKYLDPHVMASLSSHSKYLALRNVVQSWYVLATSSEEQEDTLRLPDLATICLGYMVMSTMVFMWRSIINKISEHTNMQILRRARKAMRVTAAVVKVGLLLSLKMLLLPLLLGVCLDATTLSLFGSTVESRAQFMAQHLVGSLLLHWVMGITFMLFVTVSVLQLREVVHPDLLSLIIRPQEPHPDLLGSLLQESGRTHARRMAMSLAIYLALVSMFVWLPTRLAGHLFPGVMPVKLELRYSMPQLQIPAELVILHLAMLAFLEKYQNRIGEMQHAWLVAACRRLGLTRLILPQPIITRRSPAQRPREDGADGGGAAMGWREALKAWWEGGEAGLDDDEGIEVGPPLRRPPPGWDDPAGVAQGRWAWGTEPPGQVQLNLAPRRWLGAKVVPLLTALVVAAWATVLAVALCLVVLPFLLGRAVFLLLHLPPEWTHDTACFSVGLTVLKALTPALYRLWCAAHNALSCRREAFRRAGRRGTTQSVHGKTSLVAAAAVAAASAAKEAGEVFRTIAPRAWGGGGGRGRRRVDRVASTGTDGAAARRKVEVGVGLATIMAGAALWLVVAPLLAAGLFETAFVVTAEEWAERGMVGALPWGRPLRTLALGCFLMHSWAYVCQVGLPRRVLAILRAMGVLQQGGIAGALGGLAGRPQFWQERMEAALSTVEKGVVYGKWQEVSARSLLWNFACGVVVRLSVMTIIPTIVSTVAGAVADLQVAHDAVPSLKLFYFRIGLLGVVIGRASAYLVKPALVWLKALHDSVRDDRYLVGMRLEDHIDETRDVASPDDGGETVAAVAGEAEGKRAAPPAAPPLNT